MKKVNAAMIGACLLSLVFSCTKGDISLPDAKTPTRDKPAVESYRNGGGPYVLNMVIKLSAEEEVADVNTETKGLAHLRVSSDKKLYSKVIIQKLAEGDNLRFAHVHSGPFGMNGPVVITLCATAADFGKNIVIDLTDAQYDFLLNDPAYVNAHSDFFPPGIVRGQIR